MNHRNGFNPLSRTAAHQRAMSRNMVTSLLRYERITTTKAKALEVRKAAEKIITRGKVDTVHNRRQAAKFIQDKNILAKLFTNIGPRMKDRPGGYTRILKLGFRAGDAADIVILELVDFELKTKEPEKDAGAKAKKAAPEKTQNTEKPGAKRAVTSKKENTAPKSTVRKQSEKSDVAKAKQEKAKSAESAHSASETTKG
jgi:large subunit ribosomal protein L17